MFDWLFCSLFKVRNASGCTNHVIEYVKIELTIFFPEALDPDTKILLTNAIYFKEAWTVKFNQTDEDKVRPNLIYHNLA